MEEQVSKAVEALQVFAPYFVLGLVAGFLVFALVRWRMVFVRILGRGRWALPLILAGIGYFIPAMRVPIGWPETSALWSSLFVSLVIVVFWVVAEIVTTVDRRTSSRELQFDDAISLTVFGVMSYVLGWQRLEVEWWVVLPWIGAATDAILAGMLGINNAAQKPLVTHEGGGGQH